MINFYLEKNNLVNRLVNRQIQVSETSDLLIVKRCIQLFNEEIDWDKMFDLSEAQHRLNEGHKLYVGYINQEIFGYFWLKEENEDTHRIYNVYSKGQPINRQYGATDMIYQVVLSGNHKYTYVAEVDDWNIKSQNVFNKLGFIKK